MIEISRGTALERKVWRFHCSWDSGYGSTTAPIFIRLFYYGEETRPTKRHKWNGKFWRFSNYLSDRVALKRPTSIPPDVAADVHRAIRETPAKVFAGFIEDVDLIHTITPEVKP